MTKKFNLFLFSSFFFIFAGAQDLDTILSQISDQDIALLQSINNQTTQIGDPEIEDLNETLVEKNDLQSETLDVKKYGYSFFNTLPTSTTASGDLPLPGDYRISLRDQLSIILTGSKEARFDLNVKLDGTILFPEVGSIFIAGDTFDIAKEKIRNLINSSYIGVNVDISIKNLSAKKITIVGAVNTPGTYLVNPFSTITSSLVYSGGISEVGSLRSIKLIKANGENFYFDLYDLLIYGDRSSDLKIDAGDTILIEPANNFIEITGSVKRPGIYEITEDEKLEDLLEYSLGFNSTSNKSKIAVSKIDFQESSLIQDETSDLSYSMNNVFKVEVFDYKNLENMSVLVTGAISEPGYYDIQEYGELSDLLDDLEFINVYPWLSVLTQFNSKTFEKEIILFSIRDRSTIKSISLQPNAQILFIDASDINYESYLDDDISQRIRDYEFSVFTRDGEINFPVYGSFKPSDLLRFSGIDLENYSNLGIYSSPYEDLIIKKEISQLSLSAKRNNSLTLLAEKEKTISVKLLGAVEYPGEFEVSSNSSIQDLYSLIGGFQKDADLDAVVLQRKNIKERQIAALNKARDELNNLIVANSISNDESFDPEMLKILTSEVDSSNLGRLSGTFGPGSAGAKNTILKDGDEIFIPVSSNEINVIGDVYNPNSFLFENKNSVNSYISLSGGLKQTADRKRIYIISSNGGVKEVSRNAFGRVERLSPGDTIVIPVKLQSSSNLRDILVPMTQVISDLAFAATALDNLKDN